MLHVKYIESFVSSYSSFIISLSNFLNPYLVSHIPIHPCASHQFLPRPLHTMVCRQQIAILLHLLLLHQSSIGPIRAKKITRSSSVYKLLYKLYTQPAVLHGQNSCYIQVEPKLCAVRIRGGQLPPAIYWGGKALKLSPLHSTPKRISLAGLP